MERLLRQAKKELQKDLPQAYTDFLRECNGLECNGYSIYGADDFWENQTICPGMAARYLVFAEWDIGWFCMKKTDASSGNWINPRGGKCVASPTPGVCCAMFWTQPGKRAYFQFETRSLQIIRPVPPPRVLPFSKAKCSCSRQTAPAAPPSDALQNRNDVPAGTCISEIIIPQKHD